jgi:hypothetical protein
MANSENILSGQTHPGESSTQGVTGEMFKGDGFYGRSDGIHTVQYSLEGFIGSIEIEATLATEPVDADWFILTETTHTSITVDDAEASGAFIKNFTGNYVWVRATIRNWTDGTVNSVLLNH